MAELNPQLSDDHALVVVHEVIPCHYFAINRGVQTCTLAFREPSGDDEMKTAESLLGKWKRLEEYATEV